MPILPNIPIPDLSCIFGLSDEAKKEIREQMSVVPAPVGVKDDAGKLRHALVDIAAHNEMVAVLTHGAEKYAPGNWRHVRDWEDRYFESTIRHLIADRQGEHVDKDTGGLLALACAACGIHFMLAMRLVQHPELRDSLERRLKASVAKARALKNEREAAKRRAERELATTLSGVEQRRPEDIPPIEDAMMTDDERDRRIAELTAEIERLDRSRPTSSRRKRPRAVTTSRKGDRRTRSR